jgi:hypothetical protein
MTSAYPFYFGLSACNDDEKVVVFEIDLDHLGVGRLLPDEDFIAQVISRQQQVPLKTIHDLVRANLEDWRNDWQLSLEHLGNMCYKGTIPVEAITRYCIFDYSQRPALTMRFLDPAISIENFQFCGEGYRNLVAWMFGDLDQIAVTNLNVPVDFPGLSEQNEFWNKESKDRTGIEIAEI